MNEKCIVCNLSETKFIKQNTTGLEIVAKQSLATEFKPLKAQNVLTNMPKPFKKIDDWKIVKFENEIQQNQIDYIEEIANEKYEHSKTDEYFVKIISKLRTQKLRETNLIEELCRDEQGNFRDTVSILKEIAAAEEREKFLKDKRRMMIEKMKGM